MMNDFFLESAQGNHALGSRDITCLLQRWKIELPEIFLKSLTNHNIQFHFVSKWLAIDILWKSEENQQTSQGSQI